MIEKTDSGVGEFTLRFTNGDVEKFNQVMAKYNFVDAQALIRFAVSIMLVAEDKVIKIKQEGNIVNVEPQTIQLRKKKSDG